MQSAGARGFGHVWRALRQGTDAAIAAREERSRLSWTEQRRLDSTLALLKHLPVRQVLGSLENPCTAEQADVAAYERRCQALVELQALVDDAARTCGDPFRLSAHPFHLSR